MSSVSTELCSHDGACAHSSPEYWARDEGKFLAGQLCHSADFWRNVILPAVRPSAMVASSVLSWVTDGVDLPSFFKRFEGSYAGTSYASDSPAPFHARNIPIEDPALSAWLDSEVAGYLASGATEALNHAPRVVLPIGVAVHPRTGKPRLILDARYTNLWTPSPDMSYDGLSDFKYGIAPGDYLVTVDHKSGYQHFRMTAASCRYLGFCWKGRYYHFRVLPFGWAPACFVYNTVSTVLAAFFRVHGLHCLVYLDDFGFSIPRAMAPCQRQRVVAFIAATKYMAGYFISRKKCYLHPATQAQLLGFGIDTVRQSFFVPEEKLQSILTLLESTLQARGALPRHLQSLVGKLQALSVAVPAVSLFLRPAYDQLAEWERNGGVLSSPIRLTPETRQCLYQLFGLRDWSRFLSWKLERHFKLFTDACTTGWGGELQLDSGPVIRKGVFPPLPAQPAHQRQGVSSGRSCYPRPG